MIEKRINNTLLELVPKLINQQAVLACAESCTGGWLAKSITDIDGSSAWFDCSIVTYSNQAKINLLGVEESTLECHGAVSREVVIEMVNGLLKRSDATIGVSISGIAGPSGGSIDKPVGTVWIAWAVPSQLLEAVCFEFKGDRDQVRIQAVVEAFKGVHRIVDKNIVDNIKQDKS